MVMHGTQAPGDLEQQDLTIGVILYEKYYILAYDASEDPKTLNIFSATDTQIAGIANMSTKIFDDKIGTATAATLILGNNILGIARKGRFALRLKIANSAIKKNDKVYVTLDNLDIEGVTRNDTPCVDLAPAYTALGNAVADDEVATWYNERQLEIGKAAEAKGASSTDTSILVDVDIPVVIVHPVET